jgi:large subunit ribosomal protein L15
MEKKKAKSKIVKKIPAVKAVKKPAPFKKKLKSALVIKPEGTGLYNLKAPAGSHKRKKLLGRGSGSGHGKTSTRGSKGQTSRSGRDFYLGFEGGQTPLIRRIPKRGFNSAFRKEFQIVNLADLNRITEKVISLDLLKEKGLIKDKAKLVKILGSGEIKTAISIQAHAVSKQAAEKITKAGGKVEIINA